MSAFGGLLRKEWLHILRDRRTLLVVIFMPILQVVLFGYAIRTDVSAIRLAIVDPSPDESVRSDRRVSDRERAA
jgi:ABC-2 type transport system permease protein